MRHDDHRPGVHPIFNTPRQQLRAEVQARHRADAHARAHHARSTTTTRSCSSTAPTTSSAASPASTYGVNNRLYAKKESVAARSLTVGDHARATTPTPTRRAVDRDYQSSVQRRLASRRTSRRSRSRRASRRRPIDRRDVPHRVRHAGPRAAHARRQRRRLARLGRQPTRRLEPNALHPGCPASTTGAAATHYLNQHDDRAQARAARFGGTLLVQLRRAATPTSCNQRLIAHYNTQCCGVAVEYQKFNYGAPAPSGSACRRTTASTSRSPWPGIGTFSNFFGAFGGTAGH